MSLEMFFILPFVVPVFTRSNRPHRTRCSNLNGRSAKCIVISLVIDPGIVKA